MQVELENESLYLIAETEAELCYLRQKVQDRGDNVYYICEYHDYGKKGIKVIPNVSALMRGDGFIEDKESVGK